MRVLGIDPGIARMGWGVVEIQSSKLKVKSYGCIETSVNIPIEQRLLTVHTELTKIIDEHKPDVLAIEELFFGANAKTAMIVGQARGVVLLAAAEKGLDVAVYTPLQVKIALTGYGRGEKAQVGQMVKVLLNLNAVPKPDDTADALAVAMTHAYSYKRIAHIEREKALKELLEAPATFTHIKDSARYVRKMRKLDEKRLRRLGV